jgi:hypothetical protein
MPVTVWKGQLTFGLVSVPIRIIRAARQERVRFTQVYRTQPHDDDPSHDDEEEPAPPPAARGRASSPSSARRRSVAFVRRPLLTWKSSSS